MMKLNVRPLCLIFYRPDLGLRDGLTIYGLAKGPVIWIRNDVADDVGVLNHELEHVRQFWRLGWFHFLFLWIPAYRKWTEKKALEKQIK
jgi:hypothetical protein